MNSIAKNFTNVNCSVGKYHHVRSDHGKFHQNLPILQPPRKVKFKQLNKICAKIFSNKKPNPIQP